MTQTALKTRKDYEAALIRLEAIFDSKKGTGEGDELVLLAQLIEDYESVNHPMD
jgi:HTH-type transcriptional regulator / antitoxin HigA